MPLQNSIRQAGMGVGNLRTSPTESERADK